MKNEKLSISFIKAKIVDFPLKVAFDLADDDMDCEVIVIVVIKSMIISN